MKYLRVTHAVGMAIVLAAFAPAELEAQSKEPTPPATSVRADVGWLGLYTRELADWTENGNRLTYLCGKFRADSKDWDRCRDKYMQPLQRKVTLRTGPGREAPAAGILVMTVRSGEGMSVAWMAANASSPIDFVPDFDSSNCGFFHHSYRERRGDWFRLSAGPWPRDTWVDWNDLAGEGGVYRLERDQIVESPWGNVVILGVGERFVRFRAEQYRDNWAGGEGPQPPINPFTERRVPIADLFTATGKMRLSIAYPCGC